MARDTSFYYSFLVLPAEKRRAIVAVWDFCRAVDDAVDEVNDESAAACEIARWRKELGAAFNGTPTATPQGRALAPRSEMCRRVLQADQPGLGVVALGDDSGDAPADSSQWPRSALRQVVVHRSSSVSSHPLAGHH